MTTLKLSRRISTGNYSSYADRFMVVARTAQRTAELQRFKTEGGDGRRVVWLDALAQRASWFAGWCEATRVGGRRLAATLPNYPTPRLPCWSKSGSPATVSPSPLHTRGRISYTTYREVHGGYICSNLAEMIRLADKGYKEGLRALVRHGKQYAPIAVAVLCAQHAIATDRPTQQEAANGN